MTFDPTVMTALGISLTALASIASAYFGYKNNKLGTQIHISTNSRYSELKTELDKVRSDAAEAATAAIAAALAAKGTPT